MIVLSDVTVVRLPIPATKPRRGGFEEKRAFNAPSQAGTGSTALLSPCENGFRSLKLYSNLCTCQIWIIDCRSLRRHAEGSGALKGLLAWGYQPTSDREVAGQPGCGLGAGRAGPRTWCSDPKYPELLHALRDEWHPHDVARQIERAVPAAKGSTECGLIGKWRHCR